MTMQNTPTARGGSSDVRDTPAFELDFDSDEPLPVCPMRKDGSSSDEVCEACQ
jgi:hypothetical protein